MGLAYLRLEDDQLFDRLMTAQALLRLPLVRAGERLSVGPDEQTWRGWLSAREDA